MTKRYYWCRTCDKVLRCPCGFVGNNTGPEHCGKPTWFLKDTEAAAILKRQKTQMARKG